MGAQGRNDYHQLSARHQHDNVAAAAGLDKTSQLDSQSGQPSIAEAAGR